MISPIVPRALRLAPCRTSFTSILPKLRPQTHLLHKPVPYPSSMSIRMASTLPNQPLFNALMSHDLSSTAIVHFPSSRKFTYGDLVHDVAIASATLREKLLASGTTEGLTGQRVAFLVENGYDYVVTLLSIFANNAIAVPLCTTFPNHELQYIIDNSEAIVLLASEKFKEKSEEVVKLGLKKNPLLGVTEKVQEGLKQKLDVQLQGDATNDGGMMLYTSGTTARPKGVLLPQSVLTAQSKSLLEAWNYSPSDRLLHVLPLHHIHGTVNALLTPLYAGSTIEFMFPFNAEAVWGRFAAPFLSTPPALPEWKAPINFFTVVPTIYSRLLNSHEKLSQEMKDAISKATNTANLRLNISGSAALPGPIRDAWTNLTGGNVLLERYGMTEVGMALSCGLDFADRVDGSVGWPLPSVQARLIDTETQQLIEPGQELDKDGKERHGEIQLRGPTIFPGYWRNEEATRKEFTEDEDGQGRWFKTGDVAVRRTVEGAGQSNQPWAKGPLYFIQGRKSADIIKTGGEKVSALEVEREMLSLPEISECAVVALPSDQWGQKVAAVVVLTDQGRTAGKGGKAYGPMDLRRALKERLANYKIPQEMKVVDSIPRNAMGKINKKQLVSAVFDVTPAK